MHLGAHELVGALEQLGGDDDDRGGAVAHLLVLQLRQLHQDLPAGEGGVGGSAWCCMVFICEFGAIGWSAAATFLAIGRQPTGPATDPTRTRAAGCSTSSSFRMVAPSLVMVTSPMSSTSICSRQAGRRRGDDQTIVVRRAIALTALAASATSRPPQFADLV